MTSRRFTIAFKIRTKLVLYSFVRGRASSPFFIWFQKGVGAKIEGFEARSTLSPATRSRPPYQKTVEPVAKQKDQGGRQMQAIGPIQLKNRNAHPF